MTFVKGVCYNEESAKAGIVEIKNTLTTVENIVKNESSTKEDLEKALKLYESLPITYQVNWSVNNEDANENQKIADFCRDKLTELNHVHGLTSNKIPRAFNADNSY